MKIKIILIVMTVLTVIGCSGGDNNGEAEQASVNALTPTTEHAANAVYEGIYDYAVQLDDGLYEGEPFVEGASSRPRVELIERLMAFGDLNADGIDDAAVLLVELSGGTGTHLYLAAVFANGLEIRTSTSLVGDRTQVRSLRIEDSAIRMDVVELGPSDAACCPTQMASKAWQPAVNGLQLTDSQVTGRLSAGALNGTSWKLVDLNVNEPVPPDLEITLTFEDGKIAGTSGCNRYFTSMTDHGKGQISVGEIGSTQMACPDEAMELERLYLHRLEKIARISFWLGKLSLTFRTEDEVGTLLFEQQ